ncbi:MAG TPA: penicillin-binding protein 2 [Patescibacteria group bacterium]
MDRPNYLLARIGILFLGLALVFRLTNLQIAEGNENRYLAEGNRIRQQVTVAPRGAIVDRKGELLVTNEAGYSLDLVPSDLPRQRAEREKVLQEVGTLTGSSLETLSKALNQVGLFSLDPIIIQPNLTREQALIYKIKLSSLPGVRVSYLPTRKYDETIGLSHLLGYTARMTQADLDKHPDYPRNSLIGRLGIEGAYDPQLRGEVGIHELEVNASGQLQRSLKNTPPKVGATLHLTLDRGLQAELVAALQEAMAKNGSQNAAAIAMNPQTGAILASVSLPSYDNNLFAGGISQEDYNRLNTDPNKPLLNRVVDGLYPPGSTIKPFVAAAALQEKTIAPNTQLDTSAGAIEIGQWRFPDWKTHGVTDVKRAIAESNNVFFYSLGGGWNKISGLGVERLERYYQMFGLGQPTDTDFDQGKAGLVPNPEWKKKVKKETWYIGDTYHIAIGQGDLLATPLQMVRAVSSLVNGGRLVTPHLVSTVESSESGVREDLTFPESPLPLSAETFQTVREGMYQTVNSDTGSARVLRNLPFSSGGKTGTAQFGTDKKTQAWYIGFAPYENPEIAITVIVEGGGEGNAIAVPVAGRAFAYYMSHR